MVGAAVPMGTGWFAVGVQCCAQRVSGWEWVQQTACRIVGVMLLGYKDWNRGLAVGEEPQACNLG